MNIFNRIGQVVQAFVNLFRLSDEQRHNLETKRNELYQIKYKTGQEFDELDDINQVLNNR